MLRKLTILLIVSLTTILGAVVAQDDAGVGVARLSIQSSVDGINSLNPLLCSSEECAMITAQLYPRTFDVDPATSTVTTDGDGIIESWEATEDGIITLTVRDDLFWSDGTPITAYDVMYSLDASQTIALGFYPLARERWQVLNGVIATDDKTLVVELVTPTCRALNMLDIPVAPYFPFDANYPTLVANALAAGDTPQEQIEAWNDRWHHPLNRTRQYNYDFMRNHPFELDPITAGDYHIDEIRVPDYIRLLSADGERAIEYVPTFDTRTQIEAFLREDRTYLPEFPMNRLADLEQGGANIASGTTSMSFIIALNLASPRSALSYDYREFDRDDYLVELMGENARVTILDENVPEDERTREVSQGNHPVFGDIRVRQAISLGINVQELIDVASYGYGTPVAGPAAVGAWYENTDLPLPAYDPVQARLLLEQAGWRDSNRDGVRECHNCLHASDFSDLSFSLAVFSDDSVADLAARLIANQLREIGVSVGVSGSVEPTNQAFDAILIEQTNYYPYDPVSVFLSYDREEDVRGEGYNVISYRNAEVDALIAEADDITACDDLEGRAALYQEAQSLLVEDYPYLWLYAPHEFVAASGGVVNFDPNLNNPLDSIDRWIIRR